MAVIGQPVEISEHERLKAATLEWVNAVRGEYGAEPLDALPKGVPRSMTDCALLRALAGTAHPKLRFPPTVLAFVNRFDAGHYPELIDPVLVVC